MDEQAAMTIGTICCAVAVLMAVCTISVTLVCTVSLGMDFLSRIAERYYQVKDYLQFREQRADFLRWKQNRGACCDRRHT